MNAIVVITTKEIKTLSDITIRYMEHYAKKWGAELIVITEDDIDIVKYQHPKYYIMSVSEIVGYDRILLLDADIFVKPDSPNIFEVFPEKDVFYAYNEVELRNNAWKQRYERIINTHATQNGLKRAKFRKEHWNGGVTLFPGNRVRDLFKMPPWKVTDSTYTYSPGNSVKQQPWRNYLISISGITCKDMGRKYNCLPSSRNRLSPKKCYFIHLTGFPGWRGGELFKLNYLRKASKDCLVDKKDLTRINNLLKNKKFIERKKRNAKGITKKTIR